MDEPARLQTRRRVISLHDAYTRFRQERETFGNAYDCYRRQAQRHGKVSLGRQRQFPGGLDGSFQDPWSDRGIRVWKDRRRWVIDEEELEAAIGEHRAALDEQHQLAVDYKRRILHGEPGKRVDMEGGSYIRSRDFHRFFPAFVRPWKDASEYWICSRCFKGARLEHNRPECHTCSDWGSCGRDCTLSRVYCEACGTSEDI